MFAEQKTVTIICNHCRFLCSFSLFCVSVVCITLTVNQDNPEYDIKIFLPQRLSPSRVNISWEHDDNCSSPIHYHILTHIAISVHNGQTHFTYRRTELSDDQSSLTLDGVSRSNFNIFYLDVVHNSAVVSHIFLEGKPFPPIPIYSIHKTSLNVCRSRDLTSSFNYWGGDNKQY